MSGEIVAKKTIALLQTAKLCEPDYEASRGAVRPAKASAWFAHHDKPGVSRPRQILPLTGKTPGSRLVSEKECPA